eukprot:EG_transcript_10483
MLGQRWATAPRCGLLTPLAIWAAVLLALSAPARPHVAALLASASAAVRPAVHPLHQVPRQPLVRVDARPDGAVPSAHARSALAPTNAAPRPLTATGALRSVGLVVLVLTVGRFGSSAVHRCRGVRPAAVAPALPSDPCVGNFVLESAATCSCQKGKTCRAGAQPWRGLQYEHLNCGEDSFFLTPRALGLADGVTASRSAEQDPSILANALMRHARDAALRDLASPEIDPVCLIRQAFNASEAEGTEAGGAATVLVASVTQQGELITANLGDSALMVVRAGEMLYRTQETEWQFNVPYMLEASSAKHMLIPIERRNVPEDCAVDRLQLQEGDLIVLASDGLWDNLFPAEILKFLAAAPDQSVAALAQLVHGKAVQTSQNRYKRTPFMANADAAGMEYQGGKPDDCTIIVARVRQAPA